MAKVVAAVGGRKASQIPRPIFFAGEMGSSVRRYVRA